MDIYAVAGGDGSGKTTTALNVVVAFRADGQYAAVLDAETSGNVTELLDLDHEATLADVIDGDASVRAATTEHELSPDDVPESDLLAYRESLAEDRTTFRSSETELPGVEGTDFPDIDTVPVIAGWPSERKLASVGTGILADALEELAMAYDAIVVDTGGESVAATAPVGVADGVAITMTPDETHVRTANATAIECQRNGVPLIGTVLNRATDRTDIGGIAEEVGMEAVGVVPADDRTASLEPVRYSVPDSPAAKAYDRLVDSLADWSRAVEAEARGAADGGGPSASAGDDGDDADGTEGTAADDGDDDADDDDGGDGLLGRFIDD
jgi:MinD-like ATPase involved in chromosome partitioning or flagellar assembly